MKFASLLTTAAAAMLLIVGCQKSTVEGPSGKKLTIVKPADQTVKRGDTNQVTVAIGRDNFKDAVAIQFDNLPNGVSVEEKEKKIPGDDKVATFTLKADPEAALVSNHEAKVTAVGPDGMKVTESFKITVKDNK